MQTASYIQEEKLSKFRKFSALEGPVSNEPVSYIKSVSSGDNMLGNLKPFWFTFWRGQRSVSTISSDYDNFTKFLDIELHLRYYSSKYIEFSSHNLFKNKLDYLF